MANETNGSPASNPDPDNNRKDAVVKKSVYGAIIILLLIIGFLILNPDGCNGAKKKMAGSITASVNVAGSQDATSATPAVLYEPLTDNTIPVRRKPRGQPDSPTLDLVTTCKNGVAAYFNEKKGKSLNTGESKACTPAVASKAVNSGKAGGNVADAKKLKEALARAAEAEEDLKSERQARLNDNLESGKRIKYLSSQISILVNNKATDEQNAALKSEICDDPNTSIIRITTDTKEWFMVEHFFLSNDPGKTFHAPFPGQEGRNIGYMRCLDVSKPFYLVLEMQVADDEDPNFIGVDEDGNPGMMGGVQVFAENYSYAPIQLTEDHITQKPVRFTYLEDGQEQTYEGYAFKVEFPKQR